MLAPGGDRRAAEALAELPGFVAADVHLPAGEAGQIVGEQAAHERERGVVGPQGARKFLEFAGERMDPAFGAFGEGAVTRMAQPALHMSERVQVRHELDAGLRAGPVQRDDLRRRQRGGVAPGVLMAGERERVLDVKLQLVGAQGAQGRDQPEQLRLRRHPAAGDVQHEAADGEGRGVVDFQAGQGVGMRSLELGEGLGRIQQARGAADRDAKALRRDQETIGFGAKARVGLAWAAARGGMEPLPGRAHRPGQVAEESMERMRGGRDREEPLAPDDPSGAGQEFGHLGGHEAGLRVRRGRARR